MEKSNISINNDTIKKLVPVATEAGLSVDKLADILLSSFVDNQGRVFTGRWKEGPGIRILPDWPRFSSGVVKIKTDEMK